MKKQKQKKITEPVDGFTWDDLAGKIDWEGGIAEAFVYHGVGEILDPRLKELVEEFKAAHRALEQYLQENGGLL